MLKGFMAAIYQFYTLLIRVISSKKFFYAVIILVILQGIWSAVVFQPRFFDEQHHVGSVMYYVENPNPFSTTVQDEKWDYLGDRTQDVQYAFYYALSVPLRVLSMFTDSYMLQVVFLRMIMVALFVGAFVMYRKLFERIKINNAFSNLGLLLVALLPNIAPLASTVNYDNLLFFLFSVGLYISAGILKSKRVSIPSILTLLIIATLAIMSKFTVGFVLFLPIFIYLFYDYFRPKVKKIPKYIKMPQKMQDKVYIVILVGLLFIVVTLAAVKPIGNMIETQSIKGNCAKSLGVERCSANPVFNRDNTLKDERLQTWKPYSPYEYASLLWGPSMINTNLRISISPAPFPIMQMAYFTGIVFASVLILVNLKYLLRNRVLAMLLFGMVFYTVVVFIQNYHAYVNLGLPVAMNGRYLLPFMPVFATLSIFSLGVLLKNRQKIRIVFVVLLLPIFMISLTQGGGISTLIIADGGASYWKNSTSPLINEQARRIISPMVMERTPFNLF